MTREITIESIGQRLAQIDARQTAARDVELRTANAESLLLIANALELIAAQTPSLGGTLLPTLELPQIDEAVGQFVALPAAEYANLVNLGELGFGAYIHHDLNDEQRQDLAAALLGLDAEVVADWVGQQREDEIGEQVLEVDVTWPNVPSVEPDHGTSDDQFDVEIDEDNVDDEDDVEQDFATPAEVDDRLFADNLDDEARQNAADVFAEEKAAEAARKTKGGKGKGKANDDDASLI